VLLPAPSTEAQELVDTGFAAAIFRRRKLSAGAAVLRLAFQTVGIVNGTVELPMTGP